MLSIEQVAEKFGDGFHKLKDGRNFLVAHGQAYQISPLDPQTDMLDLEKHYALLRNDPVDAILSKADKLQKYPQLLKEFMDRAYADLRKKKGFDKPTDAELLQFLRTRDGLFWSLARQLRRHNPELTDDQVWDIIRTAGFADVKAMANLREATNERLGKVASALDAAGVDMDEVVNIAAEGD